MTPQTKKVLESLRKNNEGIGYETEKDGKRWRTVYLDNARIPGIGSHAFASHLGALEKLGLYKPQDDKFFGDVVMED